MIDEAKMKEQIDGESYEVLLKRWRHTPIGYVSIWFQGEMGQYYQKVMNKKRAQLTHEERVAASKQVGWG